MFFYINYVKNNDKSWLIIFNGGFMLFFCKVSPRKWANILMIVAFLIWGIVIALNITISLKCLSYAWSILFAIGAVCTGHNIIVHWPDDRYIKDPKFKIDKIVMYFLFTVSCLVTLFAYRNLAGWYALLGLLFWLSAMVAIKNREKAVIFHE